AMAHTLGALFGVPHGLANAILLPFGMRFNASVCADRYAMAAEALGARAAGAPDSQAADAAAAAVDTLTARLGLPPLLRDVGVPRDGLRDCAEQALSDAAIVYNPRPATADDLEQILNEAW
ncbi:MAG TPA: iron-containing alcohol dehydrogenase, partial [bacterium]|nr:iron-containing alcohol dehydrogenase [bacterium]